MRPLNKLLLGALTGTLITAAGLVASSPGDLFSGMRWRKKDDFGRLYAERLDGAARVLFQLD